MAGDTHGYWLAKHAAPRRNISAARGDAIFVITSASDEAISHFRMGRIDFTSSSQVCGFIATIRSVPLRAPICPLSEMRISYQVGSP